MSSGAAGSTAICVPINRLWPRDGIDRIGEVANVGFASDSEFLRMVFCMHFMVQAGVVGLVVIDVIKLIHNKTFPFRLTEQAFDVIF